MSFEKVHKKCGPRTFLINYSQQSESVLIWRQIDNTKVPIKRVFLRDVGHSEGSGAAQEVRLDEISGRRVESVAIC